MGSPGRLRTMGGVVPQLDLSAEVSHGISQSLEVTEPVGRSSGAEAVEGEILYPSTGGDAGIDPLSGCVEAVDSVTGPPIVGQVSGESPVIELSCSRK